MPFALPSPFSMLIGLAPLTLPSSPVAESCGTLCGQPLENSANAPITSSAGPADFPNITGCYASEFAVTRPSVRCLRGCETEILVRFDDLALQVDPRGDSRPLEVDDRAGATDQWLVAIALKHRDSPGLVDVLARSDPDRDQHVVAGLFDVEDSRRDGIQHVAARVVGVARGLIARGPDL